MTDFHQWSTTTPLVSGGAPPWAPPLDQHRIAAYKLYEEMYWTVPTAFKMQIRGDTNAIYIPSARQVVEVMHRYLAPRLAVIPDPTFGTEAERLALFAAWEVLRRRERFYSGFSAEKRYGLMRGDSLFQIEADPNLPPGARITLKTIDPGMYYPIEHPDDPDVTIGAHLAWQYVDDQGKAWVQRLTYRKTSEASGPSEITMEEGIFDPDEWLEGTPERMLQPQFALPAQITAIPIYHMPNFVETGSRWGSSEFRGMERLFTAINQGISDEDVELVLNGLGVYATDAGPPVDAKTGEPTEWTLGPAKVLQMPGGTYFKRISGTTSVSPYQEHLKYLHAQIDQTFGISATAKGRVDVDVAESGVALALELGPIITRAEEKELVITDVLNNMLFDIRSWLNAYEGMPLSEAVLIPAYGDKIPFNRKERFTELMDMYAAGTVPLQWLWEELTTIGYNFPDATMLMEQLMQEKQLLEDVTGARIDNEIGGTEAPVDETEEVE